MESLSSSPPAPALSAPPARGASAERSVRISGSSKRAALVALTCLTVGLVARATPDARPETLDFVRIGPSAIQRAAVERALENCAHSTTQLSPRACLEQRVAFSWQLTHTAEVDQRATRPEFARARAELLSTALLQHIARETPEPNETAIESALELNAREFSKPERLRLFRILVSDAERAREIRARFNGGTTLTAWRAVAQEVSIDRATHERGGDLGFVWPDGTTDVPEVRVDPILHRAAERLKDGEIGGEIVPEGQNFAILWRRGSLPPSATDPAEARARVRASLQREETEKRTEQLLAQLKRDHLRGPHPDRLDPWLARQKKTSDEQR